MLAISFVISVLWLPVVVLISALMGFIFRAYQIDKYKKQISSLEREMLNSHAEILTLQQELVKLQTKNPNSKSLVVSMKETPASEEEKEMMTEQANRKKVN